MSDGDVVEAVALQADFQLLTIGHSNLPAERFMTLVQDAGVTAIADVRSVPFSRRFPWFSGSKLAARPLIVDHVSARTDSAARSC